jgi:hypothetical protein
MGCESITAKAEEEFHILHGKIQENFSSKQKCRIKKQQEKFKGK